MYIIEKVLALNQRLSYSKLYPDERDNLTGDFDMIERFSRNGGSVLKERGFSGISIKVIQRWFEEEINQFGRKVLVVYKQVEDHRGFKALRRAELRYL